MGHVIFHPEVTLEGTQISAHVPDSVDAHRCAVLSVLTFMLPNADGCGTGLQLSAKEVVLGRPDIFQSEIPRVSQSKIRLFVLNESVSTYG